MDAARSAQAPASSATLAADLSPLADALGSPSRLTSLAALSELVSASRPTDPTGVRLFLERFRDLLLLPVELPAVRDAYHHAARGEVRELIQLDHRLAPRYGKGAFAEASRHVGRIQLRRLRPLRDRSLQRFLAAVDQGEASGWHVVVYGVLLSLFSLPLRQGLQHYAQRTHDSLLESASLSIPLSPADREQLQQAILVPANAAIQSMLRFPLGS
jgi:urease accessory protein UreF